jgi:hypothetical protein
VQYGPLVLWALCGVGLLLLVQHSARQMLEQSSETGYAEADASPLVDLNSVDVHFRHMGRETLRLHAARLVLLHDLRTIRVDGISDGVANELGRPILMFAAGRAQFDAGFGGITNGSLHIDQTVSARTTSLAFPVQVSTSGIDWQWPRGLIVAAGPVQAQVGSLGTIRSATLVVDPTTQSATFSSLTAVADSSVVPIPEPATGQSTAKSGPPEQVIFQATQQGHWDEQSHTLTIDGPVTIREGKVEMQTIGAIYDHSSDIARALTPVKIVDDKNTLLGDHGSVNFQTHIATLDGNVELSATPTPTTSAKSDNTIETQARKPTQMFCDHIVYNYRTKIADSAGHLKIVQTERTVTADTGTYDTNAQMITLDGDVDGHDTDGKHVTAPSAKVSVDPKNEYIDVKGPITYTFPVNSADNPLPAAAQSSGARPAPTDKPATSTAPTPTGMPPAPPRSAP